jgi:glycosyltransferase involved in cell wall biosynthesis
LIFPSGMDTFGNVVVESLASGTPAIVSDLGGPKEIVGADEACGRILKFQDENSWLKAMNESYSLVNSNNEEYEKLREKAFIRGQYFSLDKAGDELWDFYQSLFK